MTLGCSEGDPFLPCQEASDEPSTPIPGFFPEWFVGPTEEDCVTGVVQLDPSMPYLGALSPKPCGTFLTGPRRDQRKLLWDPRKPLPGLHPGSWDPNHKEPLYLFSGENQGPKVKVVTPQEVCFLLNGKLRRRPRYRSLLHRENLHNWV